MKTDLQKLAETFDAIGVPYDRDLVAWSPEHEDAQNLIVRNLPLSQTRFVFDRDGKYLDTWGELL
jgi:hypothetical protein